MNVRKKQRSKLLFLLLAVLVLLLIISTIVLNKDPADNKPDNKNNSSASSSSVTSSSQTNKTASEPPSKIDKTDWKLYLVNEQNPLPDNWKIETKVLKGPNYPINGKEVDARIYDALIAMMDAARESGHELLVCSAYRNYQYQVKLFDQEKNKHTRQGKTEQEAYAIAKTAVAIPGTSEHNLGLAVDIVALSHQTLDESLMDTKEIKWLYENSYRYGFIVRYPQGKSEITKIMYEPWHYRYVGVEAATEIMQNGLCLEEYLQQN